MQKYKDILPRPAGDSNHPVSYTNVRLEPLEFGDYINRLTAEHEKVLHTLQIERAQNKFDRDRAEKYRRELEEMTKQMWYWRDRVEAPDKDKYWGLDMDWRDKIKQIMDKADSEDWDNYTDQESQVIVIPRDSQGKWSRCF